MKLALTAAVSVLCLSGLANAQGVSSTDDLIRALRPQSGGATRGIRPVEPSAVPQSAPTYVRPATARVPVTNPAAPAPAAAAPGVASVNMRVLFETGSDRLTPEATRALDNLGRALSSADLREFKFRIEGHTDAVGTKEANDALSARRASAVVEYIATHYGVDRARLVAVGMGQSQMLVPTAEGVSEPRNRRVQIVNLGS